MADGEELYELDASYVEMLIPIFEVYDIHKNGVLDERRAQLALQAIGLRDFNDFSDHVNFHEFTNAVGMMKSLSSELQDEFSYTFDLLDKQRLGRVSGEKLRVYLRDIGFTMPIESADRLSELISSDGSTYFTRKEFVKFMMARPELHKGSAAF